MNSGNTRLLAIVNMSLLYKFLYEIPLFGINICNEWSTLYENEDILQLSLPLSNGSDKKGAPFFNTMDV